MSLTIDLPADVEAAVREEARKAGVTPEDWLRRLAEKSLGYPSIAHLQRDDPSEWIRQFHEWVGGHRLGGPVLPNDAMSRESIYEDRG